MDFIHEDGCASCFVKIRTEEKKGRTTENMNSVSLSSSLGMGMEYNLTENLSLNLEPTFRYYLNPISGKTGIHPYSIGVFSGVSYRF